MVSVEYCVRVALRYDTAMSRAMLRACGVDAPEPRPRPGQVVRADRRYDGIDECFRNSRSPMDLLR